MKLPLSLIITMRYAAARNYQRRGFRDPPTIPRTRLDEALPGNGRTRIQREAEALIWCRANPRKRSDRPCLRVRTGTAHLDGGDQKVVAREQGSNSLHSRFVRGG